MVMAYEYSRPSDTRCQNLWVGTLTPRSIYAIQFCEVPHEHTNRVLHNQKLAEEAKLT